MVGSPDRFWRQQVHSYAMQVEPVRHKNEDKVVLTYEEALKIEKIKISSAGWKKLLRTNEWY